jgi:FkbM family methyltransferase
MRFQDVCRSLIVRSYRAFAARPSFRPLNELLFECSMRGLGILNYENEFVSGERHLMLRILPKLVGQAPPFFVDVGANIGNYSIALLKAFPLCSVVAIEPQPTVFDKLTLNLAKWSNAKVLNIGVGSASAELELFNYAEGEHTEHASIYKEVFTSLRPSEVRRISIPIEPLDAIVERLGFQGQIDLLKIDTEGHEFEVLKGCERLLSQRRIASIQLEFNDVNCISGVFLRDMRKLLHDFRIYRLLPNGLLPVSTSPLLSELFAFQNLFFIRCDLEFKT